MLRKITEPRATRHTPHAKSTLLVVFSGVILALPFISAKLWFCSWLAFIPLFSVLNAASKARTSLLSFAAGIVFWSTTIYWLVHVTVLGASVLILYLALYFVVFGLLIRKYMVRGTWYAVLFIPSLWVLLEYIRSHLFTGFPWALLSYSQYLNLPAIQIADITGAWGVSFLVMMVNVTIFQLLSRAPRPAPHAKRITIFTGFILLCVLAYGYYGLYARRPAPGSQAIKISVIQGNIPQELKWDPRAREFILNKYERLTIAAAEGSPDLIIWPEASSPGLLGEDDLVFQPIFSLAKNIKPLLLIGTVSKDKNDYFNSAILINHFGEIAARYDKLHLVPFGEYIPLKKYIPFLETIVPIGDIAAGKEYTIFEVSSLESQVSSRFGVLICFEDLFSELSRRLIREGAQFLVNITNDAWYKETTAPYQHLQACVFRAVENRAFLARAANTGISGFIDPRGGIISLVADNSGKEIFVEGFDTRRIEAAKRRLTFYNRHGDYFVLVCLFFVLCPVIMALRKG